MRRFWMVCPKRLSADNHFVSRTRSNLIRLAKMGVKIAFTAAGGIDGFSHLVGFDTEGAIYENVKHVYEGISYLDKGYDIYDGEHMKEFIKKYQKSLVVLEGLYRDGRAFSDVNFNEIYQVYLNFLPHRSDELEWNVAEVAKTEADAKDHNTFRTADAVEATVNNPIVKGVSLGYFIVAGILTAIPVTTPVGATMLAVGGGVALAGAITSFVAVNVADSSKFAHLMSILIRYWKWEVSRGCSDPVKPFFLDKCNFKKCSIVANDCSEGRVCLRELLFSGTGEEGEFDQEFEVEGFCSKSGYSLKFPTEENRQIVLKRDHTLKPLKFSKECQLHRDCASGYCHFASHMWESENMWEEFIARHDADPESVLSDIPSMLRSILLDGGRCGIAVPPSTTQQVCEAKESTSKLVTVSRKHKFKACVYDKQVSSDKPFERLDDAGLRIASDDNLYYERAITVYSKVPDGKEHNDYKIRDLHVYYYWYSLSDFPTMHKSLESIRRPRGREHLEPVQMNPLPWMLAQQGTIIGPLKCHDNKWECPPSKPCKCDSFFYQSSLNIHRKADLDRKRQVKFGDYVAMVFETPTTKDREASAATGLEPEVKEFKYLYFGGFWTDIPVYKDLTLETKEGRLAFPIEAVFQLRETVATLYNDYGSAGYRSIKKHKQVAIVPMKKPEKQLCNNDFTEGGDQSFDAACDQEYFKPLFGSGWATPEDLAVRVRSPEDEAGYKSILARTTRIENIGAKGSVVKTIAL